MLSRFDTPPNPSLLWRYGVAVVLLTLALAVHLTFESTLSRVPFFFFWPAVILASWFGGLGPGLFTALVSIILVNYFFLSDRQGLTLHGEDLTLGLLFALCVGFMSWLRERDQRAHRMIQKQAEEHRVTLSSIGDGVITVNLDRQVTFINPVAEKLTGWKLTEAFGRDIREVFNIVHEQTRAPVKVPVVHALEEGVSVELANNTILIARDRTELYIADSGSPIRNEKANMIGAVLVFRDVTERYLGQHEVIRSEQRYRSFVANSSEGIWRFELEKPLDVNLPTDDQIDHCYQYGVLAECNDAMARMYGFERSDDIVGARLGDLLVRSDPANTAYLRAFIESGYRLSDAESHEVARDGTSRYFLNNLVGVIEAGKFIRAWGTQRDITERKQAEDRARLLQTVTAALLEPLTKEEVAEVIVNTILDALGSSVGTVFVMSDDKQNLLMLNRKGLPEKTYQQYRVLPANFPGPLTDAVQTRQPIWIESFEEYVSLYPQFEANIRENGTQASACIPFHIHDRTIGGLTISFNQRHSFSLDDRALLLAVAQQCGQAIERARLYEIEQTARLEAEEANRLKLQFLAMISHELRTPLTSIKGFASTLLTDDIAWDEQSQNEFIGIIDEEADKLTELVEELLDLSRLQVGTLSIAPEPQPLQAIIDRARAELDRLAVSHQLTIEIPVDLPPLRADGQRLAQVVSNLVSNAAKYSPPGTTIRLSAQREVDAIRMDIADEGSGIAPEDREIAFEAFRQLERKGEMPTKGAGLGLAICKGLVEAHGGRIWIQDKSPGTTVSFTIPIAES